MATVTVTRELDADPEAVRDAMADVGAFMRAAEFTDVTVDGERISIQNRVGIATIELTLALVDEPGADLAYEQVDGIFERMVTTYTVEARDGGTAVTATTEFALDVALVGMVLDATVIKRQRKREFAGQFEYLADVAGR